MARPKSKAPARRYHLSGQSVVTIQGQDYYLGPHDSPEALARYAVLIGIYQQNGLKLPDGFDTEQLDRQASLMLGGGAQPANQAAQPITVGHVTALFREHIKIKYANNKQELDRHNRICDKLDERYGEMLASDFGPVKLADYRSWLVDQGLARKYVNRLINCVVAVFRHAVAGELIGPEKITQLQSLEPLRYGQTKAPEKPKVKPVDIEAVRATAKHLPPPVKAMIRVQLATGMRPGEVCKMTPGDIDRSGETWIYVPSSHKTAWRGTDKAVPLNSEAMDAIKDYLNRRPDAFLFSPKESMAWRRAVAAANRKTPRNQGNRKGTNRKENPKSQPRDHYDPQAYRQAIRRAAEKAKVEHWTPYQIRHLAATEIRSALGGLEEAKSLLGHSTALMTSHYAKVNIEAAKRAAEHAPKL